VLTDEDFANLPLFSSRRIDVLLRDALENSGKVAIVTIALRQRESLATLRVREGVFVLETMLWPDEVREPDFEFPSEEVEVRPQEPEEAPAAADLLSALRASVEAAKKGRSGDAAKKNGGANEAAETEEAQQDQQAGQRGDTKTKAKTKTKAGDRKSA
jgi:DNA end-binding protein Ku